MKLIMENWRRFIKENNDVDPHAETLSIVPEDDPRPPLPPENRRQRQKKLEMLQSYIELRNAQPIWLAKHNEGKPYVNILDQDGEEYRKGTTKWSVEDIERLIKIFQQGLDAASVAQQAVIQRQSSGITPPEGFLETLNNEN